MNQKPDPTSRDIYLIVQYIRRWLHLTRLHNNLPFREEIIYRNLSNFNAVKNPVMARSSWRWLLARLAVGEIWFVDFLDYCLSPAAKRPATDDTLWSGYFPSFCDIAIAQPRRHADAKMSWMSCVFPMSDWCSPWKVLGCITARGQHKIEVTRRGTQGKSLPKWIMSCYQNPIGIYEVAWIQLGRYTRYPQEGSDNHHTNPTCHSCNGHSLRGFEP